MSDRIVAQEWQRYMAEMRDELDALEKPDIIERILSYENIEMTEAQRSKIVKKLRWKKKTVLIDMVLGKEYEKIHPSF